MEKSLDFASKLKSTMLTLYIASSVLSLILPFLGITGVIVSMNNAVPYLLYLSLFCCVLGIFFITLLMHQLIQLIKGAKAIRLSKDGLYFVFLPTLKQQFIPWHIIVNIEYSPIRDDDLLLQLDSSLTKKQLKTILSKAILRAVKNNTLILPNSTSLVGDDFYAVIYQYFNAVPLEQQAEPSTQYFDNLAYSQRNLKYNLGLVSIMIVFVFGLFTLNVLLKISTDQLALLSYIFTFLLIALFIYSRRFDAIAPRELILYSDKLVYSYVTFRSRRRRRTTKFEVFKRDIRHVDFLHNEMIIYCHHQPPIALKKLQLTEEQWAVLKKSFPQNC